jgi:hypothetical protein
MSGTNVGDNSHTDADATLDQKPSDGDLYSRIPTGYAVDHDAPDSFLVRCTSCGHLEIYTSRARAHRKADHHGLRCAPTGVAPLTELDVATDGGRFTSDSEQTAPDKVESEAQSLVEKFNRAKPSYAPELDWYAMSSDHQTGDSSFVFKAVGYLDGTGLSALRDCGRTIRYIEAHKFDGDVEILISIRVQGEVPSQSEDTGGDRGDE